jgi:hypothetical protein
VNLPVDADLEEAVGRRSRYPVPWILLRVGNEEMSRVERAGCTHVNTLPATVLSIIVLLAPSKRPIRRDTASSEQRVMAAIGACS